MSRQILTLMTAVMVLMAAFASCKKDRTGGDDNGGGGSNNPSIINAKVVDGDDYNGKIATVKALVDDYDNDYEYVAASGKYENGGFQLNLSAVPAEYLGEIDLPQTVIISDRKVKVAEELVIFANDDDGDEIGRFYMKDESDDYNRSDYVYVDRNFTMKGYFSDYDIEEYYCEYDCSFTKGWNIVYSVYKGKNERLCTTQKPSNINFKWYYIEYYDWKKNPNDKQHPFSKMRQCGYRKYYKDNEKP